MKKTLVIFGVSSFVGSNLLEDLKDDYRIIGTYFSTPVSVPGITCLPCDVLKKDYVSKLINIFRPDATLYAVGMSSLKECHLRSKEAEALNSMGAANCSSASERVGAKFIYFSSGYSLGGEDTIYHEGDTPFPETVYGSSKSSTEFYIQRSSLNYLIFRCSPLYGLSYHPKRVNWFESIQSSFTKNEPILADDTVVSGFLDVHLLGRVIKAALESGVTNRLFHVSSRNSMTRFEFAQTYARIFKKDEGLVQKSVGSFPIGIKKNQNEEQKYFFRLSTSNIEELLGKNMPTIEESLQLTYKRMNSYLINGKSF